MTESKKLSEDPLARMAFEIAKLEWEQAVQKAEVHARHMKYWARVLENDSK